MDKVAVAHDAHGDSGDLVLRGRQGQTSFCKRKV